MSPAEPREPAEPRSDFRVVTRGRLTRYGVAVVLSIGGALVTKDLTPDNAELYALLVGVVAVAVWYGGLGPGLVAVAAGWTFELVQLGFLSGTFQGIEVTRWAATLTIALGVIWVSTQMRTGQERAVLAAAEAEETVRELVGLQELAAALSAAVSPREVARALVTQAPALLGARGGALGLIDGDELVIVDPQGAEQQTHLPGSRLPLKTRAPIAHAARTGVTVEVGDRATFEREFPDGADLSLSAHRAIAVPLLAAGEVVGSMSFLFDESRVRDDDAQSIARIAADLGGQALERAQLYAREGESNRALDRILRVSPRFHTDSAESAAEAICREARQTFGADLAFLWRVDETRLELVGSDPAPDPLRPGLEGALEEFPDLLRALGQLEISFVSDIQEEARGAGLERARKLGIHSSLRTPISIGGAEATLVLIVSWDRVIAAPDPSTLALMRRFADQAGFALEQVERRRAQTEAAIRADETRRLQEVTAALSLASTATDVSDTCLEHALSAVGAEAGFVILSSPERITVDIVSHIGYSDDELAHWGQFALDADVPFARAIASGDPVWALTLAEMAGFAAGESFTDQGWVALPLRTAAGVRGALHLTFRHPRDLSDSEKRWLETVVSQCAQALERSRLFDAEQLLRRRSERLQSMTAALSNALTRTDIAEVIVDEVGAAVSADGVALAVVSEERGVVRTLARRGYTDDLEAPLLEVPLKAATPGNRAIKRRVSAFYGIDDIRRGFAEPFAGFALVDHASFLFVPLVAGRRANGLLVLSWSEPYSLEAEERRFVETLAGQAAQALDRASQFEYERSVAETLQRSVLPASLPRVEGIQLAARYLPGTADLDVGGDWYDAMNLSDGRLGLVVGDVVGKGVQAAATMAQLRNGLRAYSLDRMKPSSTLARLNRLVGEVVETAFATVVYAVIDPETRMCRYTSAGHPPAVAAFPDGRVELLEGGRGLPLGAQADTRYSQAVVELPVGTVLVLYTDGLVERRDRSIDVGLDELLRAVGEGPREPEQLVEHVLARMIGDGERGDDIALLAVRIMAVAPQSLHVHVPSEVGSLAVVRDALRVWLGGAPLSRTEAQDVVLAVWEACANAVEHAGMTSDGFIDVHVDVIDSRVRVTVQDQGEWVPPTERPDRGLGLQMMRAAMSSVDIAPGAEGTRVTLEKISAEER